MSNLNRNSKSILARVLAQENITVEYDPTARTAMFDVANRILIVPVWENTTEEVYDMLLGHEVGHALFTPDIDAQKKQKSSGPWCYDSERIGGNVHASYVQGLLNIIEDVRIEKMVKAKYPGIRRDFAIGYKSLEDQDFFGTKGKNLGDFSFGDRLNLHFKCGSSLNIPFTDEEMAYVEMVDSTESFDDVIRVTEEVYKFIKGQNQSVKMPENGSSSTISVEFSNDSSNIGNGETNVSIPGSEGNSNDPQNNNTDNDSVSTNGAGSGLAPDSLPTMSTQNNFDNNKSRFVNESVHNVSHVKFAKADIGKIVLPYKKTNSKIKSHYDYCRANHLSDDAKTVFANIDSKYSSFIKTINPLVMTLIQQFEMKKAADAQKRTSISRSGKIDTDKIFKYQVSDDIFLRFAKTADGKNHGLVMVIDWSASMQPMTEDVLNQVIILSHFCMKAKIPFDVYMFTSQFTVLGEHLGVSMDDLYNKMNQWIGNRSVSLRSNYSYERDRNDYFSEKFALMHILSCDMKKQEFNDACRNLYTLGQMVTHPDDVFKDKNPTTKTSLYHRSLAYSPSVPLNMNQGNTPLDSTIVATISIVNAFREKHKVQIMNTIFLTDGETGQSPIGDYSYNYRNSKAIITCPFTNIRYEVLNGETSTDTLIRIFKNATNSSAIGFFINAFSHCKYFTDPVMDRKTLRQNGYIEVKKTRPVDPIYNKSESVNHSYDRLFVLPSNTEIVDDMEELDKIDGSAASLTKIRNAFNKAVEKRGNSRLFANRFADIIANPNLK
jgi:hypothetical protein